MKKSINRKLMEVAENQIAHKWTEANRYFSLYRTGYSDMQQDVRNLWNSVSSSSVFEDDVWGAPSSNNVIKAIVDTCTSKLSQVKPIASVDLQGVADSTLKKHATALQRFINFYFVENKLNSIFNEGITNKMIFGRHFYFINPWVKKIIPLKDWEVGILEPEYERGLMRHAMIRIDWCPLSVIREWFPEEWDLVSLVKNKEDTNLVIWMDAEAGEYNILFDGKPVRTVSMEQKSVPIIMDFFYKPVIGTRSQSIPGLLETIQEDINVLAAKLNRVIKKTPIAIASYNSNSAVTRADISDEEFQIFKSIGGETPVRYESPQIRWDGLLERMNQLTKQAFETVGVSELSAMGQKPRELSSGKSMQVYSDIQNARFQTQIDRLLELPCEIIRTMVDFFPPDDRILPDTAFDVTWADISKDFEKMSIQFLPSDIFSIYPENKKNIIYGLIEQGRLPMKIVASFLQIPNVDEAFSFTTSVSDAVDVFIERVMSGEIPEENIEVPLVISKELTMIKCIALANRLFTSDDPDDSVKYGRIQSLMASIGFKMVKDGVIQVAPPADAAEYMSDIGVPQEQFATEQVQAPSGG